MTRYSHYFLLTTTVLSLGATGAQAAAALSHHPARKASQSTADTSVQTEQATKAVRAAGHPVHRAAQAPISTPEDVVVTATRRRTLFSKTPVTMTAVSGQQLQEHGVTDALMLTKLVPNFHFTQDSYDARISIRGVTSTDVTSKGDASVAFLSNGIFIARPADMMGGFYDIKRVEVLRGPQGTLFGRNTTAGAVNVITNDVSRKYEGAINSYGGSLGAGGVNAMANIPVSEAFGLRGAMSYRRLGTYILQSQPAEAASNPGVDETSARLTAQGKLQDRFEYKIVGDFSHEGGHGNNFVDTQNFYDLNVPIGTNPIYRDISSSEQRRLMYQRRYSTAMDDNRYGMLWDMTYHFNWFDLTYLGGYRQTDRDENRQFGLHLGGPVTPDRVHYNGIYKDWSHELRASFGEGHRLSGQVGLYYFDENVTEHYMEYQPYPSIGAPAGYQDATAVDLASTPTKSNSKAVFGQLTYKILSNFHLTAGMRYTHDEKSRVGGNYAVYDGSEGGRAAGAYLFAPNSAAIGFDKITWKAGLDYDIKDFGMLYFTASTGYKAGGFNDGCIIGTQANCTQPASAFYYRPETITDFEGGFKSALFHHRLIWNLAAFHYDYSNLQLSTSTVLPNVGITRLISNAASAKVDGVETDFAFSPWQNGRFQINAAWTYARYDNFAPIASSGGQIVQRNWHGLLLDQAPKWSGSVSYTHTFPLANGGDFTANVLTNISSPYYIAALTILSQFRNPAYTKTDVSLTYNSPSRKWYIQGYATNLENNITVSNAATGIIANATLSMPRAYGVRAGIKF